MLLNDFKSFKTITPFPKNLKALKGCNCFYFEKIEIFLQLPTEKRGGSSMKNSINYKKSMFNFTFTGNKGEIFIHNTRTLALSLLTPRELDLINNIPNRVLTDDEQSYMDELFKSGFLIKDDCDEIKILNHRLNSQRYKNQHLSLTIAPTLNCNFNCSYCFEKVGSEKCKGIMSSDIQDKLMKFIVDKLDNCMYMDVTWYGGEPLVALNVIKKLSTRIIDVCKKKNVYYSAMMITNGYLLGNTSTTELKDININNIQITIDGPEKIHNKRRILKNGQGTFKEIINNINKYQNKMEIAIRINADYTNVNHLDELLLELVNNKVNNVTLNLAKVANYENPDDPNCIKNETFYPFLLDFSNKCKLNNLSHPLDISPLSSYCSADTSNSYVIDPEGFIYKCWQNIGNKEMSVDNLSDNSDDKNTQLFYNYMCYNATEDDNCKKCKMLPICMGGCPYNRIIGAERCTPLKYCLDKVLLRNLGLEDQVNF